MTETSADAQAALERVIDAARTHLAAVVAADGATDADAVWDAYVALNNATHTYDELLNDVYGEVTPWDVEAISGAESDGGRTATLTLPEDSLPGGDPHPSVISVRQRRDYRVPSVTALLRLAEAGRAPGLEGEELEPLASVGDAVLELLQSGDGSLGMLDVPELDPLDGVVIVAEVAQALQPEESDDAEIDAAFRLTGPDRALGRLDERTLPELED
jgi:hypothetical protein